MRITLSLTTRMLRRWVFGALSILAIAHAAAAETMAAAEAGPHRQAAAARASQVGSFRTLVVASVESSPVSTRHRQPDRREAVRLSTASCTARQDLWLPVDCSRLDRQAFLVSRVPHLKIRACCPAHRQPV
jgi:hypothetical protein